MPYALKDRVVAKLDRLQAKGIIAPTKFSQWAASIVLIVKKDGFIKYVGTISKQPINVPKQRFIHSFILKSFLLNFQRAKLYYIRFVTCLFAAGAQRGVSRYGDHHHPQRSIKYKQLPFWVALSLAIFQRAMHRGKLTRFSNGMCVPR